MVNNVQTGSYSYSRKTNKVWVRWNTAAYQTTASNTTWIDWNEYYDCTTATSASTTYNITTYATNATWTSWSDEWVIASDEFRRARVRTAGNINPPSAVSDEEVEAARVHREAARERALELLLANLDEDQRAEYEAHRQFHVTTASGRRFCIKHGRAHNVFELNEEGAHIREFCGHVGERVPDEDNVLAQKLMLEHDEEAFLRVANVRELPLGARNPVVAA